MTIKVELVTSDKQFPINVTIRHGQKQQLTKKAAIELSKKLHNAISELMELEFEGKSK